MSTFTFRHASFPNDSGAVSALLESYLRQTETEKAAHGLVSSVDPLPERYQREVASPGDSFAGMRVVVAHAAGEDCGLIVVDAATEGVSEIKRFWTTPHARGRGIGSALIRAALLDLDHTVRLSVWDWRAPAITLYRRLGFVSAAPWDERERLLCLERPALSDPARPGEHRAPGTQ